MAQLFQQFTWKATLRLRSRVSVSRAGSTSIMAARTSATDTTLSIQYNTKYRKSQFN